VAAEPTGEPRHDEPLEPEPHVEHVACLVPARHRNRRAMVAAKLDQPFGGQPSERMAHDGAARPAARAHRVPGPLGPRLPRLLDDGLAQRAADLAGAVVAVLAAGPGHRGHKCNAETPIVYPSRPSLATGASPRASVMDGSDLVAGPLAHARRPLENMPCRF